jgi:hypothetical protein
MDDKSFHLAVRFSDNLFSVGEVTEKHNEVVSKFGYVWFGKFGNTISESRIEMLNQQITKGIPTYIYLVKGNRKKSTFYQADLLGIARQLPNGEEKCFPEYYAQHDLVKFIKTWFKISQISPIESSALSKLKAVGSIYPIQETLVRSSSGYFLVHEAKNLY